jgi:ribokinase
MTARRPALADVVVVGSYNAALTIYGERLPARGETIVGEQFESGPGGKGANQAIGAKRLGADVVFITMLGADAFGEEARAVLLAEGLPANGILTGRAPTGIAMILVGSGGENMISIAPGANLELSSDDVLDRFGSELEHSSVVLMQLECSARLAADIGAWARSRGMRTILNPAPGRELPKGSLAAFDIVTPNETELVQLARQVGLQDDDLERLAVGIVDNGVRDVVVTLGERGALWASALGAREFPAYAVGAVDTTGAGDAFNAAFAAALARGEPMEVAIDEGCRAGAFCVTARGVLDGLARPEQLEALKGVPHGTDGAIASLPRGA